MAEQSGIVRVDSFPFDSKADGYDADGYPVYDRAVGALLLRKTYEKFFTDGVFGTPADALQISKGDSGLYVNIRPGIFIIKGAMGGVVDDDLPVLLDTAAPQGNIAYGIMLHYDENDTAVTGRSLSIRVVRGDASTSPTPPAPDQTTPGTYEYRLGYVTVPSGATDLSAAVVKNEKGTSTCPYAAPFDEIDLSEIVEDARSQAQEVTDAFLVYAQQYYNLVASAIDDTTAGYLMEMINNISAASFVDNVTLNLNSDAKAQIKSRAVKDDLIAVYGVHSEHMDNYLRQLLGILDPSGWDFEELYSYVSELKSDGDKNSFISENVNSSMVAGWTGTQIVQLENILPNEGAKSLCDLVDVPSRSWTDIGTISRGVRTNSLSGWVGKYKNDNVSGVGSVKMMVIGVGVCNDSESNPVGLTFMAWNKCSRVNQGGLSSGDYATSGLKNAYDSVLSLLSSELQSQITQVQRFYVNNGSTTSFYAKTFALGLTDIIGPNQPTGFMGIYIDWPDTSNTGPQMQYYSGLSGYRGNSIFSNAKLNTDNVADVSLSGSSTPYYYIPLLDTRNNNIGDFGRGRTVGSENSTATLECNPLSGRAFDINPCFCI